MSGGKVLHVMFGGLSKHAVLARIPCIHALMEVSANIR